MSSKAELRLEAQRVRSALTLTGDEGEQAAARFMEKIAPKPGQIVAAYWPIKRELDTLPLLQHVYDAGATVALPVVNPTHGTLTFRGWTPDTPMAAGYFGVPIPPETAPMYMPDIMVMPLLAFDRKGYRLGYGGGYYDRTAAALREGRKVTLVGYAYAEQICLFPLPREDHDIRVDFVITQQDVHDFT